MSALPHNPLCVSDERLEASAGWRLLDASELAGLPDDAQWWSSQRQGWFDSHCRGGEGWKANTYRTRKPCLEQTSGQATIPVATIRQILEANEGIDGGAEAALWDRMKGLR